MCSFEKKSLEETVTPLYLDLVSTGMLNAVVLYVQSFNLEEEGERKQLSAMRRLTPVKPVCVCYMCSLRCPLNQCHIVLNESSKVM